MKSKRWAALRRLVGTRGTDCDPGRAGERWSGASPSEVCGRSDSGAGGDAAPRDRRLAAASSDAPVLPRGCEDAAVRRRVLPGVEGSGVTVTRSGRRKVRCGERSTNKGSPVRRPIDVTASASYAPGPGVCAAR